MALFGCEGLFRLFRKTLPLERSQLEENSYRQFFTLPSELMTRQCGSSRTSSTNSVSSLPNTTITTPPLLELEI